MTTLRVLDICTPDYFQGSQCPTLAVPVNNDMDKRDTIEAVVDAYYSEDADLPDMDEQAIRDFLEEDILVNWPFHYLEDETDNSEFVYMYIAFIED